MQLALPRRSPTRWKSGRAVDSARLDGQLAGAVAQAPDAVGFAEEVADALEERPGRLIVRAGGIMIGAAAGDVAQALDAVGLAEDRADALVEQPGRLIVRAGGVMVGARARDVAQAFDAVGLAEEVADALVERPGRLDSACGRRHGRSGAGRCRPDFGYSWLRR